MHERSTPHLGNPARPVMEPPLQYYSRPLLLSALTTSPSSAPVVPPSITTEAWAAAPADDAGRALTWLKNTDAVVVLALLVCGLLAAIALHVVLRCALRATARAWHRHGGTSAAAQALRTEPGGPPRAEWKELQAYSAGLLELSLAGPECAICLAEFAVGEQVRVLPRCRHGFHAGCIDRWLAARPTCPTCRQLAAVAPELEHVRVDCTSHRR